MSRPCRSDGGTAECRGVRDRDVAFFERGPVHHQPAATASRAFQTEIR